VRALGGDRHAVGKVPPRPGEVAAAFVAAPVAQKLLHRHAAHHQCAGLAVGRQQHVLGAHGIGQAHVQCLMPQAGGVGAQLAGALQAHRALVEAACLNHLAIQPAQRGGADSRQGAARLTVFVDELVVGDAESGDGGFHASLR